MPSLYWFEQVPSEWKATPKKKTNVRWLTATYRILHHKSRKRPQIKQWDRFNIACVNERLRIFMQCRTIKLLKVSLFQKARVTFPECSQLLFPLHFTEADLQISLCIHSRLLQNICHIYTKYHMWHCALCIRITSKRL